MKSTIISLIFSIMGTLNVETHDIPLAYFVIEITGADITQEIVVNQEDLLSELEISSADLTEVVIMEYLVAHSSLSLSGQDIDFQLDQVSEADDHLLIELSAEWEENYSGEMIIQNTWLLGVNKQSNLVNIIYKEEDRTFRLHKGRQKTVVGF